MTKYNKQNKLQSFEDLRCWKMSREVRRKVISLVKKFPDIEKYRLSQQLVNSTRSVTANIAEGYGRFHFQENIQFCRIARGSLYETLDHLISALDDEYFTQKQFDELKNEIMDCTMVLNGYINYLSSAKNGWGTDLVEEDFVPYNLSIHGEEPLTNND
jgi:four helix bundle protein